MSSPDSTRVYIIALDTATVTCGSISTPHVLNAPLPLPFTSCSSQAARFPTLVDSSTVASLKAPSTFVFCIPSRSLERQALYLGGGSNMPNCLSASFFFFAQSFIRGQIPAFKAIAASATTP